jgi:hypothetical protein
MLTPDIPDRPDVGPNPRRHPASIPRNLITMRTVSVICNRFKSSILDGVSVLEVTAGGLRDRHPELLDLCRECSERFREWVLSPHHVGQAGPQAVTLASRAGSPRAIAHLGLPQIQI